jgi:hypothetical protein
MLCLDRNSLRVVKTPVMMVGLGLGANRRRKIQSDRAGYCRRSGWIARLVARKTGSRF